MDSSDQGIDFISSLPEAIIHHIMSFLPEKDVGGTQILSKHFKFIWSSFPIIVFDQLFSNTSIESSEFLDYVKRSIQLRRINKDLQRFRLKLISEEISGDPRINETIRFALENNVKELDLMFVTGSVDLRYKLSEGFFSRSLTYLKLNGLQFNIDWLISVCPVLKSLILSKCSISESITEVSHRKSPLTILSLESLSITNKWIEDCVSMFLNLEKLVIKKCPELRIVRVINGNLKRLDIVDSYLLEGIEIVAPNLRSVHLVNTACLTGNWLKAKVSSLRYLQDLKLHKCSKLGTIEIFNDELRCLEILDCEQVVEAEIDAKNLKSFVYRGKVISFRLMNSPRLRSPTLELKQESQVVEIPQWNLLRNMLSFFSYCETLTLVCSSDKDFIIPEDVRATRLPPLCDVKHLKIISEKSTFVDRELVHNLRWLSPHLESLCIVTSCMEEIIKFHHEEENKLEKIFGANDYPYVMMRAR